MQFQILGPLRVTNGDDREVALGGAKPAALLALLLLRPNEVVAADRLIEDLWDGQPPATAAKTLQVHVSRLRRALGGNGNGDGAIETTSGGYVLSVEPDRIDAQRFEVLVAEGRAALEEGAHARASARLRAALGIWRGGALADFAYSSFAQDEIARLEGLRTVALESAVEAELALGHHAELVPELKALVKRHPLSEHLRAQLMLALYRSGRQAEALGVYRAARRVLVDQLGLEPSAELRDLERAILEQDTSLAPPSAGAAARRQRSERPARGALVGYERELRSLEDALEDALTGQGGCALVAGEPGVGKTRLADELGTVAHARGAQVAWGRCVAGAAAPAYWPWVQILRSLLADRDPLTVRTELGPAAADLVQLLPELRDVVVLSPETELTDPEDARFRMFDAVASFLRRAAATRPLVLVLDDLHDADQSTLALLEFVAPASLDMQVLLVGTYRDTPSALGPALSSTLTELARTTDCLQLVLIGLSGEDTAHFVELSAGVAPMPVLASAIHEASSGNPLFVSELVRLLRAEGRLNELAEREELTLPRGVEQVIARRLEQLSDPCRATLALAAVVGREFAATLLERAGAVSGEELLEALEQASAARVIEPSADDAGSFRFSHDVVRETLYASAGATERRRMHAAVAMALEELRCGDVEPVVADLAHHYAEARPLGDPGKAFEYLVLAGDHAAEMSAGHEAAAHYERAAAIGNATGTDPHAMREMYVKLAEQLVLISDLRRGQVAIEAAGRLATAAPDQVLDDRLKIAAAHLALLDPATLMTAGISETIQLFEQNGDYANAARGWAALISVNCGHARRLEVGEPAARMLECARRSGSKALVNQSLRAMAASLASGGAPTSNAIARVQALRDQAADQMTRARIMLALATLAGHAGRFDEGRALLAESRAMVPRSELRDYNCGALSYAARFELLAGNMERAEEIARELVSHYEAQGLLAYLSSEVMFLVDALTAQGRLDEAAAHLEGAPEPADDDIDAQFRQVRSRARLELARGELAEAEASARRTLELVDEYSDPLERIETQLLLAEIVAAAGGDAEARDTALSALRASEEHEHVVFAKRARSLAGLQADTAPTFHERA